MAALHDSLVISRDLFFNASYSPVPLVSVGQPSRLFESDVTMNVDTPFDRRPVCQERKGTNVYVSNMPPAITANKFRILFATFGTIIGARLVKRRKGDAPVGFVQFTLPGMAQAAITAMDGRMVDGTKISVRLANRDKDKGITNKPSSNLYVANLPQKVTELDLRVLFSRYGDIHSLRILKYPNTGVSKGTALVRFVSIEDATRAKDALHCLPLQGQDLPLEVKFAETKEEKVFRRDDRGHADAQSASRADPDQDASLPRLATEEFNGEWNGVVSQQSEAELQTEDMLPFDVVAACWGDSATLPQLLLKKEEDQNEDAMRALTDYITFMMSTAAEPEASETLSWISQSSSNIDSSVGHANEPLEALEDGPGPFFPLSPNAPPFVPKATMKDLCHDIVVADSVMVEGLPAEMDRLGLYELFGPLGAVLKLESVLNGESKTRTAVVKFRDPAEAALAHSKLHGRPFHGRVLQAKAF